MTVSNNVTIGGDATADNYYHTSDRRLKSNIRPLEEGESIVAGLRPVRFNWKKGDKPSIGFIAQEVEDVLPEAVITDGNGFKAMDYDMLAAPMVATLRAQQVQIAAQQQELLYQREQIRKLVTTVTDLTAQGRSQ
ncbi:tail fiber domain-containing protein [Sphingopyxis sp. BSNA05]|uniref:tail fiber domain-containing protein n=1 Tax=Sphingopyxis sp. BSNA05 TaxID=1236614 RepID=UPI00156576AD